MRYFGLNHCQACKKLTGLRIENVSRENVIRGVKSLILLPEFFEPKQIFYYCPLYCVIGGE